MQDIIDGISTLMNANIDWNMAAGPIWWVILPVGFIAAGGVCESTCMCRIVRCNSK